MGFLLDTHTFLWMRHAPERLGANARAICSDLDAELSLSMASVWELAIKLSLGKLRLNRSLGEVLAEARTTAGISVLSIREAHLLRVVDLPFHHRDPFDRLLIAQALTEGLTLLSADDAFGAYGVQRDW